MFKSRLVITTPRREEKKNSERQSQWRWLRATPPRASLSSSNLNAPPRLPLSLTSTHPFPLYLPPHHRLPTPDLVLLRLPLLLLVSLKRPNLWSPRSMISWTGLVRDRSGLWPLVSLAAPSKWCIPVLLATISIDSVSSSDLVLVSLIVWLSPGLLPIRWLRLFASTSLSRYIFLSHGIHGWFISLDLGYGFVLICGKIRSLFSLCVFLLNRALN